MKPQNQSPEENEVTETVFAQETTGKGEFQTETDLVIHGSYEGKLSARTVTISATGQVEGDIDAETVKVQGSLKGNTSANNLFVSKTGHLEGEYEALNIGIEPGAKVRTSFNTVDEVEDNIRNPKSSRYPTVLSSGGSHSSRSSPTFQANKDTRQQSENVSVGAAE